MHEAYSILKLKPGCTKQEVETAYYHILVNKPRHINDMALGNWYNEIQSAYEYLSDSSKKRIQYTSGDILLNGIYVNCNGRSYILTDYDRAVIRKGSDPPYIIAGLILIVIGILTIPFFVGPAIMATGICGLFIKDYYLILVSRAGDTQLIHGNRFRMKKIARKINQAMQEFTQ